MAHLSPGSLGKVNFKILNSGIVLKTFTHVLIASFILHVGLNISKSAHFLQRVKDITFSLQQILDPCQAQKKVQIHYKPANCLKEACPKMSQCMRFPTMWYVKPAYAQSDQSLC